MSDKIKDADLLAQVRELKASAVSIGSGLGFPASHTDQHYQFNLVDLKRLLKASHDICDAILGEKNNVG